MYDIDPNAFMNAVVVAILVAFGGLLAGVIGLTAYRGRPPGTGYLSMFTVLFGLFALTVAVLGFRGQTSTARPWNILLDMKYQPKYRPQAQSRFFADGRAGRLPVENTVPFDTGGRHDEPNPDFLRADLRYYRGVANPEAKAADTFTPLTWENGQPKEGYYVARIPEEAVKRAGGWEMLLKHGERSYAVNCVACHGASGRGGGGPGEAGNLAYGITGAYGMANIASYHQDRLREMPDGEIFETITHGRATMAAYGHQVKVQDRWAIVAYVRALQYAQR